MAVLIVFARRVTGDDGLPAVPCFAGQTRKAVNLTMPTGILREVPRDDASARLTHPAPDIDIPAAEDAVRPLLVALGQDPEAEHLRQTPRRVAAAFSELLAWLIQALAVTHGPWRSCGRNRFHVACTGGTSPSQYREVGGPQLARSSNPCLIWLTSPR